MNDRLGNIPSMHNLQMQFLCLLTDRSLVTIP